MRPQLAIVVDTEEEFDWSEPVSRQSRDTSSIPAQALVHEVFDPLGIVPAYVIDYPVATDPHAIDFLVKLQCTGRAEIGAHLHPWVSPPHDEQLSARNSYHCNLPPALERAKIIELTNVIAANFGQRPTIFKAGRYGYGANTRAVLLELGYTVDCSFVPHFSFARDGGPRYYGQPSDPFWLDDGHTLLEVPLTTGFVGAIHRIGPAIAPVFDNALAARLRLAGLLNRSGAISRVRLTPEGVSVAEQCRLLDTLVRAGQRIFTLSYHSPSLAVGHTPYVNTQRQLEQFVDTIAHVLRYFQERLGGEFATLTRIRAEMAGSGVISVIK
jgi:hypothetical protein